MLKVSLTQIQRRGLRLGKFSPICFGTNQLRVIFHYSATNVLCSIINCLKGYQGASAQLRVSSQQDKSAYFSLCVHVLSFANADDLLRQKLQFTRLAKGVKKKQRETEGKTTISGFLT